MINVQNQYSKNIKISDSCLRRVSIYFRTVTLLEKKGVESVTSMDLADIDGRFPAQVRKDLSYFGCFGLRGVGYEVRKLKNELARVLGLDKKWHIAVIGDTRYSDTLINTLTLKSNNFVVSKIYDKNPMLHRGEGDVTVYHIDRLEETIDPDLDNIAIITLPHYEVQEIINRLSLIGVKAALYLASGSVKAPDNMFIMNQDITVELGMLTYRLNEKTGG